MNIKVEHLNKSIGNTHILKDISFSISTNGVVGLLGPNGAGKSTLMKIMTGLWNFNSGTIEYQIDDTKFNAISGHLPHTITQHIGFLPENNPLYDDMYVREYLQFMLTLSNIKKNNKTKTDELIRIVGLTPMANKRIGQLSKGYRQRVGLAQAISCNPQLLILDEPTTGLDPNQLDDIRLLIKQLGQNRVVILSTHILQEVETMCNRVIILADGQICEDTNNLNNLEQLFREKTKNSHSI